MHRRTRLLVFVVVAIVAAYALAYRNYKECRAAGFSALYCAAQHLVR